MQFSGVTLPNWSRISFRSAGRVIVRHPAAERDPDDEPRAELRLQRGRLGQPIVAGDGGPSDYCRNQSNLETPEIDTHAEAPTAASAR